MKWIDQAGFTCAAGWSGQYCVTLYVGGIRFYKPVLIGNLGKARAKLIHTGRTRMHIAVDVWAGDPKTRAFAHTTHCIIIFVAVNDEGQPVPVPPWTPETPEDQALEGYALRLMELRKDLEKEMLPYLS